MSFHLLVSEHYRCFKLSVSGPKNIESMLSENTLTAVDEVLHWELWNGTSMVLNEHKQYMELVIRIPTSMNLLMQY